MFSPALSFIENLSPIINCIFSEGGTLLERSDRWALDYMHPRFQVGFVL